MGQKGLFQLQDWIPVQNVLDEVSLLIFCHLGVHGEVFGAGTSERILHLQVERMRGGCYGVFESLAPSLQSSVIVCYPRALPF